MRLWTHEQCIAWLQTVQFNGVDCVSLDCMAEFKARGITGLDLSDHEGLDAFLETFGMELPLPRHQVMKRLIDFSQHVRIVVNQLAVTLCCGGHLNVGLICSPIVIFTELACLST